MSRENRGHFADFSTNAPSALQTSRKKSLLEDRRLNQPYVGPTSLVWTSPSVKARAASLRKNYADDRPAKDKLSTQPHRDDDETHRDESGDLLNAVGSAGSYASTTSLSSTTPSAMQTTTSSSIHALTPLTNTDSSPPGKTTSPRHLRPYDDAMPTGTAAFDAVGVDGQDPSEAITPIHTPPEARLQARPGPGEEKGFKLVYDPDRDKELTREQRKRRAAEPIVFGQGPDPRPPFDPRLSIPLYSEGRQNRNKARLRPAPYSVKVWPFVAGLSTGVWEATQVVVTGFDPFTPEGRIKTLMSSYGNIAEVRNQTDPNTGAFLGICLVRFKDTRNKRGVATLLATDAARIAAKEGTGQRIGTNPVKVELDKVGKKCERLVAECIKKSQKEQDRLRAAEAARTVTAPAALLPVGPPPDAPKGPSGKAPPLGPRMFPKTVQSLVESEPIVNSLKREPYLFIAHCYVPVLSTTIPHLQKRLKIYEWKEVRLDQTGYYITFRDNNYGRRECKRCFDECHLQPLFTYFMNMEMFLDGNPHYTRSPSPERVRSEKRIKDLEERFRKEEEQDLENEKQERAAHLDPVLAALEDIKHELCDKLMSDVKERIGAPALYDYLAPDNHVAKRRKLGVADPPAQDPLKPTTLFSRGDESPSVSTPDSRSHGFAGRSRRPFGPYDANMPRGRKPLKHVNAFQDERRARLHQRKPAPVVRGLHRQMQDFYGDDEDDSEDEQRSVLTRNTEDQESRPLSRSGSIDVELNEDSARANRAKRRRLESGWGEESDDETTHDATARNLLAHLIHKDPEQMAERELEQVLSVLPRSSSLWKKANKVYKREVRFNQSLQEYDEIFGVKEEQPLLSSVELVLDEEPDKVLESTEPADAPVKQPEIKKKPTKPKKKTKKQLLEEQAALLEEQEQEKAKETPTEHVLEPEEVVMQDVAAIEVEKVPTPEPERAEVDLDFSTDPYPRRTVEDDPEILLDIDGWQHLIKDEEDLNYLRKALESQPAAELGDVQLWAIKQKEIKSLNNGGVTGTVRSSAKVEGYYVPTPSGCARTEVVKKILESEKSKYLPHRIKVQKAREEREAKEKNNPGAAAEAAKLAVAAKMASTTSSRSNRANNRRLVNDLNVINTQKQNLTAEGDAVRFNQLKKRKKLVKFDRSAIHNWGLYAEENIAVNDMIIEYVGERVRQRVADLREMKYQMQGIGSSYLFRIDEDTVVDATKKGGIARFINHSCTPNCTAKIIKVDGTKRIVIYALRDIAKNEELTYDYKFEREINSDDRIPCLCGSIGCKGFLN